MAKKTRKTPTGYETSIHAGVLYFEDARQCDVDSEQFPLIIGDGHTKSIRLVSLDARWVENFWMDGVGMKQDEVNVQMTLRREIRSGAGRWYAYRRVLGTLHKRYIGGDEDVSQERLLKVARSMPSV